MTDTLVMLGDVIFQNFEIPEKIPFGGEHQFATHKMIGGQRVVDAMGPDDADITWSGKFRGPGALGKALAIDAMRIAGAQVTLSWLGIFRVVVIKAFKPDTEKYYEVPYSITCLVVSNPSQTAAAFTPSLDSLVSSDLASVALNTALAAMTAPITAAVAAVPSLIGAPASSLAAVSTAVAAAQSAIAAQSATYDALIASMPSYGIVDGPGEQPAAGLSLLAQIAALAGQAAAQDTYAYVTRIGVNIARGSV